MSKTKRLLAIIMCLALALSIAPLTMFASAETTTVTKNINSYADLRKIGVDDDYPAVSEKENNTIVKIYKYVIMSDINKENELKIYLDADATHLSDAYTQLGEDGYKYVAKEVTVGTTIVTGSYTYDGSTYQLIETADAVAESNVNYFDKQQKSEAEILATPAYVESLCTAYNLWPDFTPIANFDNILTGDNGAGEVRTISDLSINVSVADNIAETVVGIVGTLKYGGMISNITVDDSCSINVNVADGKTTVAYVGTFAGRGAALSKLSKLTSSAIITVNNELYSTATINEKSVATANYLGGIVGYGVNVFENDSFDGKLIFTGPSLDSIDETTLSNIESKASLNIGGIAGYTTSSSAGTVGSNFEISSTFVGGSKVAIGKISSSNKDYENYKIADADKKGASLTVIDTKASLNDALSSTYFKAKTGTIKNVGTDYQLISATCGTVTTCFVRNVHNLTKHDAVTMDCSTNTPGNLEYYTCSNSACDGIHYKDANESAQYADGEDVTPVAHTWGEWQTTQEATYDNAGSKKRTCTHAGCTAEETEVIPQLVASIEINSSSPNGNTISGKYLITKRPTTTDGLTKAEVEDHLATLPSGLTYTFENLASDGTLKTGTTVKITGHDETLLTIVIPGDTNGDGKISTRDANGILKHLSGAKLLSGAYEKAAYVNTDSKISTKDANGLLKFISGKSSSL